MLTLLVVLSAAQAACPDLAASTAAAVDDLVAARLDRAHTALLEAEAALTCGAVPTPTEIARLWLAEAALASVEGRADDAQDAWQAAARLAPEQWDERYGPELRAGRDAAVRAAKLGQGSVRYEGAPERAELWVDGSARANPTPASEGLHVVQLARRDVITGQIVLLGADEDMTLRYAPPPSQGPDRRRVAALAGGAASALVGGGALWFANTLNSKYSSAVDSYSSGARSQADALGDVRDTHGAQLGLGAGGGLLIVAGAGLAVTGVLLW